MKKMGLKSHGMLVLALYITNNPFAYNIQIFCTKHGNVPLRMIGGHCTDPTCPNAIKYFNKNIIKNNIESVLIDAQNKNS